jgi:hypothetical protein
MSPYPVIGQVTAFMNSYIKEFIGFKNIADIKRSEDTCKIITKEGIEFEILIKQLN